MTVANNMEIDSYFSVEGRLRAGGSVSPAISAPEQIVPAGQGGGSMVVHMNVSMTSLAPRGAAAVLAQNAPLILGIGRREASSRLRASPV